MPGARHAAHVQAALDQEGRVARQVRAGLGIDELVPRQPDLTAVIGVPVPLAELDAYLNVLILTFLPTFGAYWLEDQPAHTRYVPPRRILRFFGSGRRPG